MKPPKAAPVAVIGAGLSGRACARALARRDVPVTMFQAGDRVAGPWRRRHPALPLNIHHRFVRLPGQAAPYSDGIFLKRDTVVAHLERYADAARIAADHIAAGIASDREVENSSAQSLRTAPRRTASADASPT